MNKEQTKKEITMDDLALIIAKRFDESDEKIDKGFKELRSDVNTLKSDIVEVKDRLDKVEDKLDNIQADLNKKVDKIDHNTLVYQVEKMEKKFA